ncbi:MAG: hypothetical protein RL660_350 [Bacteroidota bacterium]|jgi:uncharacterized metal-binding protein YceD (DUF177 family)
MKKNRDFEIAHIGLKPGEHEFNYQLQESFFEEFGQTEFRDANFDVKLLLDKKANFYYLKFGITGSITTACDRCGDDFTLALWDDFETVIKIVDAEIVDERKVEDEEIIYLPHSANHIDVAEIMYENIVLCLPIQRVHADNEQGQSTCNPVALELLGKHAVHFEDTPTTNETNNSLREQLEQLKKKKDAKS